MVSPSSGALDGLRVVDFSRVLAGPLATMILGDLGAEVLKVERPGSGDETRAWGPPYAPDGETSYYLSVNRNKRSVIIDLGSEAGRTQARSLTLGADVVIENFRAGKMESFGLGYHQLSAENDRLIFARISGFGPAAGAELAGYDFLVQAMSGLMSITGEREGPPLKTGVAIVDVLAGLFTTVGILAAVQERERSGKGQYMEVTLLGSALAGLVNQASNLLTAGVVPSRMGNFHPSIAPYELFDTATEPLALAVGNDAQFQLLCMVLGRQDLAEDPRWRTNRGRVEHRDQLHRALQDIFSGDTRNRWISRLAEAGVPSGPVNTIAEAMETAQALGLDPVEVLRRSDGTEVATTANPIRLSRTPVAYRRPPPRLGEEE